LVPCIKSTDFRFQACFVAQNEQKCEILKTSFEKYLKRHC
jgi:hypothetical protein